MIVRRIKYFKFKNLKYRNKSCVCRQQHRHDSIKEAHYCDQLELLRKAGEIQSYEIQKNYDLMVNQRKICGIRPDFIVINKNGEAEVHEVKSYITMTDTWNIKRKLWEAIYPDIAYIVIN